VSLQYEDITSLWLRILFVSDGNINDRFTAALRFLQDLSKGIP